METLRMNQKEIPENENKIEIKNAINMLKNVEMNKERLS